MDLYKKLLQEQNEREYLRKPKDLFRRVIYWLAKKYLVECPLCGYRGCSFCKEELTEQQVKDGIQNWPHTR